MQILQFLVKRKRGQRQKEIKEGEDLQYAASLSLYVSFEEVVQRLVITCSNRSFPSTISSIFHDMIVLCCLWEESTSRTCILQYGTPRDIALLLMRCHFKVRDNSETRLELVRSHRFIKATDTRDEVYIPAVMKAESFSERKVEEKQSQCSMTIVNRRGNIEDRTENDPDTKGGNDTKESG